MWLLHKAVYYHGAVEQDSIKPCGCHTMQCIAMWLLYKAVYYHVVVVQGHPIRLELVCSTGLRLTELGCTDRQ
ncbi:hypothetical protein DPMN_092245 [Dreissena polymorpha]|uniref:Uncharacterized protein n=1 Tax=Dreissena polymorpha TaxID=45954 RepID=A0A9D4QZU6_DREPO|nr:hypothetical protein DPMN_092245 [Dreissena polymorpha]